MSLQDGGRRSMRHGAGVQLRWLALLPLAALALSACSSGGNIALGKSQVADPATVDFPIFYVKRQVPTNTDGTLMQDDLRIMRDIVPSADLFMRASASASASETNITARITAGQTWDVKDVDTSADGKRVIFAMRGPLTMNQQTKNPPSWRIYEYVIASNDLHAVIDPTSDPDPLTVNDVSPHYLPDGRIVFSSTRQTGSQGILLDEGKPQFSAQDEARQEPAFVLEVMNGDGTGVHQISFNQSHDRDATVLASGRVLWTRWDNAPGKDAMSLYSANPDGTDLELYYGANSHMTGTNNTVVEFVQPHEMQDGRILALERQYTDVDDGGQLVIIDGVHYAENTQALLADAGLTGPAQTPATTNNVLTIPGPSPGGRFSSATPLWDGTGRILISWSQCRLLDKTQTPPAIVPCTATALAAVQRVDVRSAAEHPAADHAAGRGRHDLRRGGGTAAAAAEHHPRQGAGGRPGPEPGRRRCRGHRYKECLRHRRDGYRHPQYRRHGRPDQDPAGHAPGALRAPGEGGVDP